MTETTDHSSECADQQTDRAQANVATARDMLRNFEDLSLEAKHGSIDHAIEELRNARRALPDDY